MGTFATNHQVRTSDTETVLRAVAACSRERAFVSVPGGGWTTICDRSSEQDPDEICRVGVALSKRLGTPILAFLMHDSDVFMYWLFENGHCAESFASDKPKGKARPQPLLARYTTGPAGVAAIERALVTVEASPTLLRAQLRRDEACTRVEQGWMNRLSVSKTVAELQGWLVEESRRLPQDSNMLDAAIAGLPSVATMLELTWGDDHPPSLNQAVVERIGNLFGAEPSSVEPSWSPFAEDRLESIAHAIGLPADRVLASYCNVRENSTEWQRVMS